MVRTLAEALTGTHPLDVRRRGEQYFKRGAVDIVEITPTSISALVTGTAEYETLVDWSDEYEVVGECECPFFDKHGHCKHVWATILAYDASGTGPVDLPGLYGPGNETDDSEPAFEDKPPASLDPQRVLDMLRHGGIPGPGAFGSNWPSSQPPKPRVPRWKEMIEELQTEQPPVPGTNPWATEVQIVYVIRETPGYRPEITVNTMSRKRRKDGRWGALTAASLRQEDIAGLTDPDDRQIITQLVGGTPHIRMTFGYYRGSEDFLLDDTFSRILLPQMCRTGRCLLWVGRSRSEKPLQYDDGPPWEFRLDIRKDDKRQQYVLTGLLCRQQERKPLSSPVMLKPGGWIFWKDRMARLDDHGAFQWIEVLRNEVDAEMRVSQRHLDEFLEAIGKIPMPPIDLSDDLGFEQVSPAPRPCLRVRKPERGQSRGTLAAELRFDYDGWLVKAFGGETGTYDSKARRLVVRDHRAEAEAAERLKALGVRRNARDPKGVLALSSKDLPRVVATLVTEGWNVEADGSLYRRAGRFNISVSSGIDWFELHGSADFEGASASLPQLLAALKKGEQVVRLDDGTYGVLPEEWLRKFGVVAGVGTVEGDHLRFKITQAGFLDALLAAEPEATFDEGFSRVREQLRSFERVEPMDPPPDFVGTLRPYQRDGLGWLHFLRQFGFGGCLADDMGLGKTIQVLALLESRRQLRAQAQGERRPGPSLVVVPRSLIFNWQEEAARFTPRLRVLDHTGTGRAREDLDHFDEYDLVLTTYGTLRRDAAQIKNMEFDYFILDESQSIKNAGTASAKAARLVKADHRLCLTGTPIENHLGELWSQFEVLNPGMLGTSSVLAAGANAGNGQDEQTRQVLSRALRPFILRRTKSQVATDLPDRTEQTIYCQLDGSQRKQYDQLRDHYRQVLLDQVSRDGLNKAKIQVLEALLRLRQAAIHPGLIDSKRAAESSAKLEALLPRLQEVADEGQKTLVFSQFTKMLGILRTRLDELKIPYEYLDGQTRDRQAPVNRFQNDPGCKLFLISLKAGGLGLNLTAAEYVFLLDPWWNPAVEAQAIDRAHRIGQERHVFAYRLIAKDTVEDRILELQRSKRELADAIINADNSLIRDLSREDLELLLA